MKDLVDNRKRIPLSKKIQLGGEVLRQNGFIWTSYLGIYYVSSSLAERAFAALDERRKRLGLPGLNSAGLNKLIWEAWDWTAEGEEWTPSPEWKESVLNRILRKHMPEGGSLVEIGPGGGRWTETLLEIAGRLVAVDISAECLRVCAERFQHSGKIEFVLTPGNTLPGIADGSVDAIWSFDVFVHINRREVEGYAAEFARVLRPGGTGVLHHGTVGGKNGGWRSDMTEEGMAACLRGAGLEVVEQFREWTDGNREFQAGLYDDAITVFRKP
jgi:ubiquinone/menaquinone biosynthesis C-methylase UbiE